MSLVAALPDDLFHDVPESDNALLVVNVSTSGGFASRSKNDGSHGNPLVEISSLFVVGALVR